MVGKGEGAVEKLSDQIAVLKYVMIFWNVILWILGLCVFALCMWIRFEPGLGEWITKLELQTFYAGAYVLIVASLIMLITPFLGCLSAMSDNNMIFLLFIASQILSFIVGLSGSAVMLDYSTQNSKIQPMIRESMRRLIMNTQHLPSKETLAIIQENIGCCGADGPVDYTSLHVPIPNQCRDTVTGNPFFHGCVDELSWFFEEKTTWITGLTMSLCFMNVVNVVLSIILMQALKKEDEAENYRR